jgi:hypothetical protein
LTTTSPTIRSALSGEVVMSTADSVAITEEAPTLKPCIECASPMMAAYHSAFCSERCLRLRLRQDLTELATDGRRELRRSLLGLVDQLRAVDDGLRSSRETATVGVAIEEMMLEVERYMITTRAQMDRLLSACTYWRGL